MKVLYYVEKELAQFDPARRLRGHCEHLCCMGSGPPLCRNSQLKGLGGRGPQTWAAFDFQGQN